MSRRSGLVFVSLAAFSLHVQLIGGEPAYAPEPELEQLIEQTSARDRDAAQAAMDRLASQEGKAKRALNWHLFREKSPAGAVRWAELLARCTQGSIGYRVLLELQPEGAGTVTLSSDRALLAECGKRFARINGQQEPQFSDDDLKHNPYSKAELLKHLNDSVKFLEARVEPRGEAIEAIGILNFKNFDAFASFGDSFDADAYNMLAGTTLTDSASSVRTLQYRAVAEEERKQYERNLLLFHNINWEYVLDFKGRIVRHNATRKEGTRLIWIFNCYQMLTGQAVVQLSYDATGLPPRSSGKDTALPLPQVAQGNQPTAVVTRDVIRAKVCETAPPAGPRKKEILRELNQLIELDGSGSLPPGGLTFQWAQTHGPDLGLSGQQMARPDVSLIIKEAGEYRFELVVSSKGVSSKPAEVKVFVDNNRNPAPVAVTPAAAAPVKVEPVVVAPEKPKPSEVKPPEPKAPEPKSAVPVIPQKPPTTVATPVATPTPVPAPKVPPATAEAPKLAVAADPAKAKELHEKGISLLKQFKFADAKPVLSDALALHPADKQISFDLGVALLELGEYQQAIVKFEDMANTRNAKALMNIGHAYARLKNLGEAGRWYRRGAQIGKGAVEWESRWQSGHTSLIEKDYKDAVMLLTEAEKSAMQANIKDPRLLYDLAQAYHGLGKKEEAQSALAALEAMGYTPDPALAAAIRTGAAPVKPVAAAPAPEKPVAPPTETKRPQPAPETVKPTVVKEDKSATSEVVDLNKLPAPTPAKPVAQETRIAEVKKPETSKAADPAPAVKPEPPVTTQTPVTPPKAELKPVKKAEPKVVVPRKPLPPIPADYDQAMAAGKNAYDEAQKFLAQSTEESRQRAGHGFDEAEAMYRGALKARTADEAAFSAMKEISKHVGAIALVRSTHVKAKVRGLVVLDAEPSIVAPGRPMYCVWEQVEGEDLGLRPENMAQKKVGIRIPQPGMYAFELAVSDGSRGGTPVKVTVEVSE